MDSNLRFPIREVVISAFPKWNGSSITEFLVLIDTRDPTDRFGQDEARTLQPRQRVPAVVKRPQRVAVGPRDDDKSDLETMMPKVGPRVRIHFAPAASLQTISPSREIPVRPIKWLRWGSIAAQSGCGNRPYRHATLEFEQFWFNGACDRGDNLVLQIE
jgi:hypothetical protein